MCFPLYCFFFLLYFALFSYENLASSVIWFSQKVWNAQVRILRQFYFELFELFDAGGMRNFEKVYFAELKLRKMFLLLSYVSWISVLYRALDHHAQQALLWLGAVSARLKCKPKRTRSWLFDFVWILRNAEKLLRCNLVKCKMRGARCEEGILWGSVRGIRARNWVISEAVCEVGVGVGGMA